MIVKETIMLSGVCRQLPCVTRKCVESDHMCHKPVTAILAASVIHFFLLNKLEGRLGLWAKSEPSLFGP